MIRAALLTTLALAGTAHADTRLAELQARVDSLETERLYLRGELAAERGRASGGAHALAAVRACRVALEDALMHVEGMRAAVRLAEDEREGKGQ